VYFLLFFTIEDSVTPGATGKIYKTTQNSKIIFDKETCLFDLRLIKNNDGCQITLGANWPSMANESLTYDTHIAGYTSDNNLKGANTAIIDKSRYCHFTFSYEVHLIERGLIFLFNEIFLNNF